MALLRSSVAYGKVVRLDETVFPIARESEYCVDPPIEERFDGDIGSGPCHAASRVGEERARLGRRKWYRVRVWPTGLSI